MKKNQSKPIQHQTANSSEQNFAYYATQAIQEVYSALESSENGLTDQQIPELKNKFGLNKLKTQETTFLQIVLKQLASPFVFLLIAVSVVYLFTHNIPDASIILLLVLTNTFLGVFQEYRSYRSLRALKKYIVDKTRVIRNGKEIELETEKLLPGDIVKLYPGDNIPADLRFITVEHLMVNEAALTGESAPVEKTAAALKKSNTTIFDASSIGFSGTLITSGTAKGIVFATGKNTYFGSVVASSQTAQKNTAFMQNISRLSKAILYVVLATSALVFITHLALHGATHILNVLMFSMALGIAIVPEALPVVVTFSLARGALHLAKFKVIVKRLSAIEDLGSMQVLCIDKTGTITENILKLSSSYTLIEDDEQLLLYGLLASGLPVDQIKKDTSFTGPLWNAISEQQRKTIEHYTIVDEHPFEPEKRYASILVKNEKNTKLIIRGNIQTILDICSFSQKVDKHGLLDWAQAESNQGNRVLLLAVAELDAPVDTISEDLEKKATIIGGISYQDPLKPTAQKSLERAQNLNIQVKVISGDIPEVNNAVAKKIKLMSDIKESISGEELAKKSHSEKKKLVEQCSVFAHILPDQKVEIIELLKKNKHDVGYLGDGINDAPALKVADVSIAVNTAADIARDAADIILLQKSLRVIVDGIHEGRIIFSNLMKYIKCTLAANFGHFYSLAIVSFFIDFLPMLPSQLLLVGLLTDLPLIAISSDTVQFTDIAKPKKYSIYEILTVSIVFGILIMLADFLIFGLFYTSPHERLQTNWFIVSILIELSFFYSIRTTLPFYKAAFPSYPVLILSMVVAATSCLLPFTKLGQELLHFTPPTAFDFGILIALVIGYFMVTDIIKVLWYKKFA